MSRQVKYDPLADENYQETLAKARLEKAEQANSLEMSSYQYGASAFAKLSNSFIDYSLLKVNALQAQTQASSIELQAKEQANIIREQFNQQVGTVMHNATQRGVKVGEGSIAKNIEESSANLGSDISKMNENAKAKANLIRSQSKINKRLGKAQLFQGLTDTLQMGNMSYSKYKSAKKIRKDYDL